MRKDTDKIEQLENKIKEIELIVSKSEIDIKSLEDEVYERKVEFLKKNLKFNSEYNYVSDDSSMSSGTFIVKEISLDNGKFDLVTYTEGIKNWHKIDTESMFDLFTNTIEAKEHIRLDSIDKILEE